MKIKTYINFDESVFNEWMSVRSRVGRRKRRRITNVRRRQAAKRAWKMGGRMSRRRRTMRRYHKSPPARRLRRYLNQLRSRRNEGVLEVHEYELLLPYVVLSLSEHMSWLVSRDNDFECYEEVFEIIDIINEITECPELCEFLIDFKDD